MTSSVVCIRPMPVTGSGNVSRDAARKGDVVRCMCGQPTCRDADYKHEHDMRRDDEK